MIPWFFPHVKFKSPLLHLLLLMIAQSVSMIGMSQKISGHVTNSKSAPVEAATIGLYPVQKYAITDSNGDFSLNVSEDDTVIFLEVTHVSYQSRRILISDLPDLSAIEITLQEAVVNLEEVTVVQSGILQKVMDNSQSVVSIDKDFIAKNSTGTFSGALAALAGVNTMNVGVGIAKPVIRGMSFNRILVNNRGIKQEGQQWGADHGLEIDPFDVESVEVIKGPASLLFGSDGMGGVIRIKENKPLPANGNTLELSTSYQTNNHAISNSLEWKGRRYQWFYSARVTYQDYGDYTVPADEFTYAGFNLPIYDNRLKNTAGNELHFSGMLGYQAAHLKSSLRFTSFNQKAGIFTGAIGLPRAYNLQHNGDHRDIDVPRQENQHNMLISNTTIDFGAHQLEIDLGYQHNIREELSFPGAHGISPELAGSNLALGLYLDTYTANVRYEVNPTPKHQVLLGGQFQYMNNNKAGFEYLLPVYSSFQSGFYHYQLVDISENWTFNAGIRYDLGKHAIEQHLQPVYDRGTLQPTGELMERTPQFDRKFDNFSGATGLIFKANQQNHLKLNLGSSFRFPTPIELSSNGVHHGNFRHEIGDKDLQNEQGYQVDFTYLHQSENVFLEVSAYYAYYKDYIYLAPTGNFSFLPSGGTTWEYRQNDALYNGFEVAGSYDSPFNIKADLAIDFVQNLNLDSRLPLPLTPQASVLSTIEYYDFLEQSQLLKDEYFFVSGRYNFAQNRTDRNEKSTPESFLIDMGLGFSVMLFEQTIQCNLTARNLLNTPYFNHISRYRLINLPEQGRNFIISVQVPIQF